MNKHWEPVGRYKVFCSGVGVMYYWASCSAEAWTKAEEDGYYVQQVFRG